MYGQILNLGLKAVPHLIKAGATTAALGGIGYGGATAVAGGVKLLGGEDSLNNLYRDQLVEDSGVFKPKGFTAQILKPFVEEQTIEQDRLSQARNELLVGADENPADYNFSPETTLTQAQGQVIGKRKERERKLRVEEREDRNRPLEMQYAEAAAARADAMLMNANSLAFQREQLAQQDRQYNLDLDRKARMDQERAFLALMGGGLDALGAAFA